MAGIILAKAIDYFAEELGCVANDSDGRDYLIDKITEAIEYLLLNGGGDILKEWVVPVRNGKFTFPRDLETPVKYKLSRIPNLGYGTFSSAYLSYSSNGLQDCCDYYDWDPKFAIHANKVATAYQPPSCGSRILATTTDDRDVGKNIMVKGKQRRMDVAPTHNGFKTAGELLTIYKEDDNEKKYSAWALTEITEVVKDLTCSYVMLSGLDADDNQYFFSHYHPDETVPRYTQGEMFACPGPFASLFSGANFLGCDFLIHILGRVNPNTRYIRDEDVLPIDSHILLRLLARRTRYDDSGDFNEVANIEQRIAILIKKQVSYNQASLRQLSFNMEGSPGSLTIM